MKKFKRIFAALLCVCLLAGIAQIPAQAGWRTVNGKRAYFKNGERVRNSWVKTKKGYSYVGQHGFMRKGWITVKGKTYYLNKNGVRVTGTQFIKGKGYYFNKKGVLQKDVEVRIDPSKPMIALTFDDGPGPYTERLLNCLEKNDAVATFFVVGSSVNSYQSTVKRAYKLGCEIGNHSWDHPQLTSLGADGLYGQISRTNSVVKSATGQNPTVLRPPYGAYNSFVASAAGMPLILWDVDTLDWKTRNTQSTISSVLNNAHDGSIVLMHDIHEPTVAAAETIVPELKRRGYQLVTVSEMAQYKKKPLSNGSAYTCVR